MQHSAQTAALKCHVPIKNVLHCITRSKTIATAVNSSQIVRPIPEQTDALY